MRSIPTIPGGRPAPFAEPIYVTRPLLPPLASVMARFEEVWATQQLTNIGAQHEQLESALRTHLGVRELSLFTNGTVALITAIRALGCAAVLTTPFTFPATPHALSWSGITPVFCDIDPVTLNIDPRPSSARSPNGHPAFSPCTSTATPAMPTGAARRSAA